VSRPDGAGRNEGVDGREIMELLFVGALVGASQSPGAPGSRGQTPVEEAGSPRFTFYSPTATPTGDHPSPDIGYLKGVEERGDQAVLLFDRVTVHGSQAAGYTITNESDRIRKQRLTDDVKVTGGQLLTGGQAAGEVPRSALLSYLREKAGSAPLLTWLRYDDDGRVTSVQEQSRP
jgi:hypothetical protein